MQVDGEHRSSSRYDGTPAPVPWTAQNHELISNGELFSCRNAHPSDPASLGAIQHSRRYTCFLADDPTSRQHDSGPQYQHCGPDVEKIEKINCKIQSNIFESAAEFVRRQQRFHGPARDNLLGHFPDGSANVENTNLRFMPDRRIKADTVASENFEDESIISGDRREFGSTAEDPLPLNLSRRRTVSDIGNNNNNINNTRAYIAPVPQGSEDESTAPRSRDRLVPQVGRSRKSCTELPRTATGGTRTAACRQKLIVGDEMYDIVTVGHGIWLLGDACKFQSQHSTASNA